MGFLKHKNRAIKNISKEEEEARNKKIGEFLREIDEVYRKHKLMLVPIILKHGPSFEVQEVKEKAESSSSLSKNNELAPK